MKKTFIVSAVAALMATQSAFAEDFKIGVVSAKTGFLAAYDAPFMQGVHMYADEANANGGLLGKYPIDIVERDDGSDLQKTTVLTAEVLAANADLNMAITSALTPMAIAGGIQTLTQGMLTMHGIASQPTIPARLGEGSYLVMMSDAHMGGVYAKYAADQGLKSAYLVTSDFDPYTEFMPLYFAEKFEEYGGTVAGQSNFAYDQQEFSSVVAEIKALPEEPEIIFGMPMDNDFPIFIQQLRAAGIKSTYFGPDILDLPSVKALGPVVDGVLYVTMAAPQASDEAGAFIQSYEEKFGNSDSAYPAMVGYSAMQMVAQAAEDAGTIEKGALRAAFGKLTGVPTKIGLVTFDGFGALPNLPVHIMKIQDGVGEHVTSIKLTGEELPAPRN
ncbi:MAG: ABC transporter substrate-binding protein [Sedimentitalea sp.]